MWSVVLTIVLCTVLLEGKLYQPGYGYIGPVCAVVDGILFLHGVAKRNLDFVEVELFRAYQRDLSSFKKSQITGFLSMEAPLIPYFCGGYDDSVEIVLNQCIVRNNHVYIDDKLIRSLTNLEKQKIETITVRRAAANMEMQRMKREIRESISKPGLTPRHDISYLLHRLLNVNSTVTSRFMPVVSQSPLFSVDGNNTNVINLINNESKGTKSSNKPATKTIPRREAKKLPPSIFPTKIDSLHESMFITSPTKRFTRKMSTPVDSVTTSTIRSLSFQPIYPVKKTTQSKQLLTKRKNKTAVPERNDGKVVLDHIILRMISQALTNNGLFETVPSTSIERLDEKATDSAANTHQSSSPFNFTGLQFSQKRPLFPQVSHIPSINDIQGLELPNEICTAHLNAPIFPRIF